LWKVHDQIVPTHRLHREYVITSKVYLTPSPQPVSYSSYMVVHDIITLKTSQYEALQ